MHRVRAVERGEGSKPTILPFPRFPVARPKLGAPQQEIILPGNIQAFIEAPIYARTNGYLKRWYVDIGGRVKRANFWRTSILPSWINSFSKREPTWTRQKPITNWRRLRRHDTNSC